jgi:hypothetical protein
VIERRGLMDNNPLNLFGIISYLQKRAGGEPPVSQGTKVTGEAE